MNRLSRSTVVIASCAAALAAAVSPADAAWTAAQELPNSAGRYPLFAAYGAGGATRIGMYGPLKLFPGTPQVPVAVQGMLSAAPASAPAELPDGLGAPVALAPNGTMLAVGGPRSPLDYFGGERRSVRLRVGIGPVDGTPTRIATHGIVAARTLAGAVNGRGDAAVVFARCIDRACAQRSVFVTFRRRGRGFAAPILLARRTGHPAAAVALNTRGDAIVAWIQHRAVGRGNDIRVRMRRASGTLTKVRLAGPTAPVPAIAVTLTDRRQGTVAWFSQPVGGGSAGGSFTVSQANLNSRGELSALNILDHGNPTGRGDADAIKGARLRAILGADSAATYVWTGFANGRYVVRANRLHRDSGLTETLSPLDADAQLMDVAGDVAGDVLAVWATVPGTTPLPAVAAVMRPGGAMAFGAPQLVLSGVEASGTAAGAIAPGGRAIVVGGPQAALGTSNPPGVRVTQLLG